MNSMLDDDAFYRVKMVEMDMEAWGLMEERQVNWDWTKIKYVNFFFFNQNWDDNYVFFLFVPLQGDDGFPGYPGQKVILSMKISFVPLIWCCLLIYFSFNSSGRGRWSRL